MPEQAWARYRPSSSLLSLHWRSYPVVSTVHYLAQRIDRLRRMTTQ
ncbi:hypothetical protein MA6G0125S_1425 [Mycobacteroides abscessus 6G-0125-S]|nr:hypothetical protein MA6G0125S_1425 [Mycobacteroides abscessus 6G-0125-S]